MPGEKAGTDRPSLFSPSRVLPVAFAAGALLVAIAWIVRTGVELAGVFAYPLDDTYIHLAIVRNFLEHGVWGVNVSQSTSASSSPLWTLLLAAGGAVGLPLEPLPLVLAVAASVCLVAAADALFRDAHLPAWPRALALVAVVAVARVPTQAAIGMEHVLHTALALWFLLSVRRGDRRPWWIATVVLAAMLPLVRFEALVMIGAATALRWRASRRQALVMAAAALVPLVVFALVSAVSDWWWLPNSVLRKVVVDPFDGFPWWEVPAAGWVRLAAIGGALISLALLHAGGRMPARFRHEAVIVWASALPHLVVPLEATLNRYTLYLSAMVTVSLLSSLWHAALCALARPRLRSDVALVAALAATAWWLPEARIKARDDFRSTPIGMRNIADQQRESARFVRDYLTMPGPVVINDLGFVAYAGGRDVIDLVGLGDASLLDAHLDRTISVVRLGDYARAANARVAVVYASWVESLGGGGGGLPPGWIAIGHWTIDDNAVCADERVTVFALDGDAVEPVRQAFAAFAATLALRTTVRVFDDATPTDPPLR